MLRRITLCLSLSLAMLTAPLLTSVASAEVASSYGSELAGNPTASGDLFNPGDLTAAHPWLPFGTLVLVCNINTGSCVTVRINDRGPFGAERDIDLSTAAAAAIDGIEAGVFPVTLTVL